MRFTLNDFKKDDENNVFLPLVQQEKFSYSDGEIENKIFIIIENANDLSLFSRELLGQIVDWPTEYHLSPLRHNLLRHINFKSSDKILELGCGCGAITRQLGETGADVFAVEGSLNRARIASSRCRDLPNVKVFSTDFSKISFENQFDMSQ